MKTTLTRRQFAQSALVLHAMPPASKGAGRNDTLVAFRISTYHWVDDRRFDALLAFFAKYPGTADELAFFTGVTHIPRPLEEMERFSKLLEKRMTAARQAGMGAGINVLATIGHLDENLETSLNESWQRVVDPRGRQPKGSYCPCGREFLGYVDKLYATMAQAGPEFIWVDDDVRTMHHPPVQYACFCGDCLRRFSEQTGRNFTREALVKAFSSGTLEERLELRRQWLDHNRSGIDGVLRAVEQAVHRVKPDAAVGLMCGGSLYYDRFDHPGWTKTMAGPENRPVRYRPGGGFYNEERMVEFVEKAHHLGSQIAAFPPQVQIIQSEIENFPYDLLRKSAWTTAVEAATYQGAGATGTAFNVLSQRPDPLDEYEPILRRVRDAKPFYATLRAELGRSPVIGVWPAWNNDIFAANSIEGRWPDGSHDASAGVSRGFVLSELGIPVCYDRKDAVVTVFSGPALLALGRDEVRTMLLRGGVLMDVAALEALESLGLGELAGVRPGKKVVKDGIEQLTKHPANGKFAGYSRDCRQSFSWNEPATLLEPRSPNVTVMAKLIDYQDRELGNSMTAYESSLGGRVVVAGYFPWSQLHNFAKSSQMKAVCDWLSRGRMPVVVDSFARIHVWARKPGPGKLACVVLNGSQEPLQTIRLRLRGQYSKLEWVTFENRRIALKPGGGAAGEVRASTPPLAAWNIGLLLASA
ncbi:MAG TPA: hypothetical protein VLE22_00860 [Bryobacteraceae bacterium]|nr:hypothetical protein [Bryobacteraceae bacterium]